MSSIIHPTIDQYFALFMVWFFFVFGIAGFAVGVGLVSSHEHMHRFFGVMNRWVSMRPGTRWLAIPRTTSLLGQRLRSVIGAAFILVAAYSTFILVTQIDVGRIVATLRLETPRVYVTWIMESMRWLLIVGGLLAIAVGVMLAFFQNALLAIETRANHWGSFRGDSQSGDAMHLGFDRWIESYPRTLGCVIAVAALVVVVDYGLRLFPRP